ncbi:alpha/beta hydrolase [Undibacterium crateris]|uniref:alpha/beta hydrolase n=1 Tax=Undibacterium crateris TaxID=2528175 RepID=UPI00138957D6|nr:alpha/beta hydrolase [Undibacterium crateris]NDI87342.1 alpha/beta hydrolase fold domain-containing protein [Undibacterium crateris]
MAEHNVARSVGLCTARIFKTLFWLTLMTAANQTAAQTQPWQTFTACGGLQFDFLPAAANSTKAEAAPAPAPLVLVVHGGGWSSGSREDYHGLQSWLSQQGLASLSIDYRLAPAARFPAQAEDTRCALQWVQQQAPALGIQPDRLAGFGISAGAHLLALTALPASAAKRSPVKQAALRCVVLHGAPTDLLAWWRSSSDDMSGPMSQRRMLMQLFGQGADQAEPAYRAASPLYHVKNLSFGSGGPRWLLLHGEQDVTVPVQQAQRFTDAIKAAGGQAELLRLPDTGHIGFGTHDRQVAARVSRFYQDCLKK